MTLLAAATYLKTLREAYGISQDEVARSLGTSTRVVGGWERAETDPASSSLAAFTRFVHASAEHVVTLLINPDATQDDGVRLAHQWLEQSKQRFLDELTTHSADEPLRDLLTILRSFSANPRKLGQLLGYAERLLDEDSVRRRGRPITSR
jgi:transcriptional regulator with XRE-family HTH domain